MTAPNTSAAASTVPNSGTTTIDALLSGDKWGSAAGSGTSALTISYSFPWKNGLTALFSGPGVAAYSSNGEQTAAQHFGLNNTQQIAAINALSAWSNLANISFQPVTETATNVGDVRFAFSSATSLSKVWGYAWGPTRTGRMVGISGSMQITAVTQTGLPPPTTLKRCSMKSATLWA